ncbi:MAG: homoserine kinase [Marmoricola sp.]|nr:homoserine kinase [Marmoricola sp.]
MALLTRPVTVEVPATSANLGPGFDCLGLALELADTLVAEVAASGVEVTVEGEGADEVPLDERHLVVRAMHAAFAALGETPPGLRLTTTNRIPHGRGLGSSSAAIVGGIVLARALVEDGPDRLDDATALRLASRIEGHADNVGPALLGGLVVCGQAGDDAWAVPAPLDPGIGAVVFVPPDGVLTHVARSLLPASISHDDAVANTGRAALLVLALGGRPDLLLRATEDFLHQRHRGTAMPASLRLVEDLRAHGVPAVVSGAGPTVLALTASEQDRAWLLGQAPEGWRALSQRVGGEGARVLV